MEKLAARDPANTQWQTDLVVSLTKIASVLENQGAFERKQAAVNYERALKILRLLPAADRLTGEQKDWIKWTEDRMAALTVP